MTEKKSNIYIKLKKIQSEATELIKDENNPFHKYKYFNEKQCLELLKPLWDKHNVAYEAKDDPSQPFIHEREGKNHFVKYLKKFILVDADNPTDRIEFPWWTAGENNDIAKAKGSAETYAAKYFFQKAFAIPVKDDNDADAQNKDKPTEYYSDADKFQNSKIDSEKAEALYKLFDEKRGNDLTKQKALLKGFNDVFVEKYKMNGETNVSNFRMRIALLKGKDYADLWNWLATTTF